MAALGMVFSLGAGCAKEEPEVKTVETAEGVPAPDAPQGRQMTEFKEVSELIDVGGKKIIALCCGSDGGYCETFLSAASMGAAEFGVETELIKAATLDVNVLEAYADDDVNWINEKTLNEDCALICAVPCYHVRANSLFYAINERMGGKRNPAVTKITRVGAVIGVGGSGYDGWASLTNLSTEIYMQHTRKVVDQVQFNFCGLREWNLWMQQGKPLTSHTHLTRCIDEPWHKVYTMWGEQPDALTYFRMAVERAKQLGRNVAQAMDMPIEEVEYKGERAGVECPLCHCNILLVPEDLPYVGCPICWIRGTIVVDSADKMKIEWNMKDLELKRFEYEGQKHHREYTGVIHRERTYKNNKELADLKDEILTQRPLKVISPYA
jgi:multimeric flavodoxin WrbA